MARSLTDRVAVITGGGTGIGRAIAHRLADEGCRLVIAGRRRQPIERVAHATDGLAIPTDVTVEDDVRALFAACDRVHGRLDILVNGAGVVGAMTTLERMDMANWDHTIAVNLCGVALCIKYAIPLLRRPGGAVVNVSSRGGLRGARATATDYVASKFALTGLTESMAQELGPLGIRVNDVCPGIVATDMLRRSLETTARDEGIAVDELLRTRFVATAALRRPVGAEEVAEAVVFLASDAAGAITGQHLMVDCGRM